MYLNICILDDVVKFYHITGSRRCRFLQSYLNVSPAAGPGFGSSSHLPDNWNPYLTRKPHKSDNLHKKRYREFAYHQSGTADKSLLIDLSSTYDII